MDRDNKEKMLQKSVTLRMSIGDLEVIEMIAKSTRRNKSQVIRLIVEKYIKDVNNGNTDHLNLGM